MLLIIRFYLLAYNAIKWIIDFLTERQQQVLELATDYLLFR